MTRLNWHIKVKGFCCPDRHLTNECNKDMKPHTHTQRDSHTHTQQYTHIFGACLFICVYPLHVVRSTPLSSTPLSVQHIMRSLCLSLHLSVRQSVCLSVCLCNVLNVLPLLANPLPFWSKLQKHKLQFLYSLDQVDFQVHCKN